MGTKKNIKSAALVKASSVYSRQFKQHYVTVQCLVTDGRTDGRTGGGILLNRSQRVSTQLSQK